MHYHFCGKIVKRSGGKDATAACAYNTRSCVYDRTTGLEWNHTYHKDKVIRNHRYLPAEHPAWAEVQKDEKGRDDYGEFWNLVEEKENRINSQFARAIDLAYQSEFTYEQQVEVLERWIEKYWTSRGISVDVSEHHGHVEDDGTSNSNDHAHLLIPTRKMDKNGWTTKDRESNDHTYWQEVIRKSWADENNLMFDYIFIVKHQEEYDQVKNEIKNDYQNQEELHKEVLNRLYDEYPDEWIYISEKKLSEQRDEVDQWLEVEEAKDQPNKKRIERFEKKFQELDREAQQHMGKAHRMAKKGKETKRKKYRSEQNQADAKAAEQNTQMDDLVKAAAAAIEDPMLSENDINFEDTLSGVAGISADMESDVDERIDFNSVEVTDEEMETILNDDPVYQALLKEKEKLLKEMEESISEENELSQFRQRVESIETWDQLNSFIKDEWKPYVDVVYIEAQRTAIIEDVTDEKSELQNAYQNAAESIEDKYKGKVEEGIIWINQTRENELVGKETPSDELDGARKDLRFLDIVTDKFKTVFNGIKKKAAEIVENSPLRVFKMFRQKKEIVSDVLKPKFDLSDKEIFEPKINEITEVKNGRGFSPNGIGRIETENRESGAAIAGQDIGKLRAELADQRAELSNIRTENADIATRGNAQIAEQEQLNNARQKRGAAGIEQEGRSNKTEKPSIGPSR